jgi:hypothetical protein
MIVIDFENTVNNVDFHYLKGRTRSGCPPLTGSYNQVKASLPEIKSKR